MLHGSQEELSLSDLIQIGAANRRTLRARVRGAAHGEVFLERGELKHATYGELIGCDAIYAMLADGMARYEVEADVRATVSTVYAPVAHVLLEAARLLDEGLIRMPATAPALTPPRRAARGWRPLVSLSVALAVASVAAAATLVIGTGAGREPLVAARPEAAIAVEAVTLDGPDDALPVLRAPLRPPAPAVDLALRPTVVVRTRVDEHGHVTEARIYRSRLELAAFEDAALDAVNAAAFEPARHGGVPAAAWINVPVSFADAAPPVRLQIKGSDTIGGALGPELAAAFHAARPEIEIAVEALGSATAFVGLLDGTADLGASSRPVDERELAAAAQLGVSLQEIVIGYDGIAVIVHPDSPLRALTVEQVARLFTGEIARWSELGGPDRPVRLLGRPDYSGTHGFFRDKVLRRGDGHGPENFAPGYQAIEESAGVVAAVAADPDAIAYVGVSWVDASVRSLALSPGGDRAAVAPSAAAILDGSYPVYRPLLVYTRGAPAGASAAFLRFVLSADGQALVTRHGFVSSDLGADDVIPADAERDTPTPAPAPALRIAFRSGAVWLSRAAGHDLDAIARRALDLGARLLVVGHADAEGGRTDKDTVARRRAAAVAARLHAAGLPLDRITTTSAGDAAPLASNTTRTGRTRNRRADVFLVVPDMSKRSP